jgi:hypothetical protein
MVTRMQFETRKNTSISAFTIAWKMNTSSSSEVVNGLWYVRCYFVLLYSVRNPFLGKIQGFGKIFE